MCIPQYQWPEHYKEIKEIRRVWAWLKNQGQPGESWISRLFEVKTSTARTWLISEI